RGPDALNFVGCHLLALPAPPQHDAPLGLPIRHGSGDRGTDRRVVDGLFGVGAEVVDGVPVALEQLLEVLLEAVTRVVGADRNVHGRLPRSGGAGPAYRSASDETRCSTSRARERSTRCMTPETRFWSASVI